MSPMVVASTTLEIVSMKVVTLTSLVFSLTISRAFAARVEPSPMEELSENGRRVRYVASTRDDQKETKMAARREA
jgi:hypothetical protein